MRVMVTGATTPFGAAIVDHLLAAPDVELVLAVGREREADPGQGKLVYHAADRAVSGQLRRPRFCYQRPAGQLHYRGSRCNVSRAAAFRCEPLGFSSRTLR